MTLLAPLPKLRCFVCAAYMYFSFHYYSKDARNVPDDQRSIDKIDEEEKQ